MDLPTPLKTLPLVLAFEVGALGTLALALTLALAFALPLALGW